MMLTPFNGVLATILVNNVNTLQDAYEIVNLLIDKESGKVISDMACDIWQHLMDKVEKFYSSMKVFDLL